MDFRWLLFSFGCDIGAHYLFWYYYAWFWSSFSIMIWSMWSLIQLNNSICSFIRLIVSVAWVVHIVIYLLISPPLSPFLNEVFIKLDSVWGNFGLTYFIFPLHNDYFLLSIILIFMLCYLIRSSGYCSFCFLLLLPSACGDCWGNDAWSEISFRYDSPHEVMDFCRIGILFLFYLFVAVGWHFSDHSLIELICSQMGSHTYELFSL